jgi:WD40 repeat protein
VGSTRRIVLGVLVFLTCLSLRSSASEIASKKQIEAAAEIDRLGGDIQFLPDPRLGDPSRFVLTRVAWLRLDERWRGTDNDLTRLAELKDLYTLELTGDIVRSESLKIITQFTNPYFLDVRGEQLEDEGLRHVSRQTALEELHLASSKITNAGLAHLEGLRNLRSITIDAPQITDEGLKHLQAWSNARKVNFPFSPKLSPAAIVRLGRALPRATIIANGRTYGPRSAVVADRTAWSIRHHGLSGEVLAIAVSPDGKTVASAGNGSSVHLWEIQTGRMIGRIVTSEKQIHCLAFSPDGRRLATGGLPVPVVNEKRKKAWLHEWPPRAPSENLDDELFKFPVAPPQSVKHKAPAAEIWDLKSGKLLRRFEGHHARGGLVRSVAFTADGTMLVSQSSEIILWNATSGKRLKTWPSNYRANRWERRDKDSEAVEHFALSPTDNTMAVATRKGFQLLELPSGDELACFETDHDGFQSLAFANDGKRVAIAVAIATAKPQTSANDRFSDGYNGSSNRYKGSSGGFKGHVQLWDLPSGKLVRQIELPGDVPSYLVMFPDATTLAVHSNPGTSVGLWDLATGKLRRQIQAVSGIGERFAFSGDGRLLLSGSARPNGRIRLWETDTGREQFFLSGPDGRILERASRMTAKDAVHLTDLRQSGKLVHEEKDGELRLAIAADRLPIFKPADPHVIRGPRSFVVARSIDGHLIVTFNGSSVAGGSLVVFDRHTRKQVGARIPAVRTARAYLSPDGKVLAWYDAGEMKPRYSDEHASDRACSVHLVDVETGKQLRELVCVGNDVRELTFLNDSESLITRGSDGRVRLWDVRSGSIVAEFSAMIRKKPRHDAYVGGFAVSSDRRVLATVDRVNCVRLYEVVSGQLLKTMPGGRNPDELGRPASLRPEPLGHDEAVSRITFFKQHPDWLATTGDRDGLLCWDLVSGRVLLHVQAKDSPTISRGYRTPTVASSLPLWSLRCSADGQSVVERRSTNQISGRLGVVRSASTTWHLPDDMLTQAPSPLVPTKQQLLKWWTALKSEDAAAAWAAIHNLARSGPTGAAFLKEKTPPVRRPARREEAVRRWIERLESEQFAEREAASKTPAVLGRDAEAIVRKTLESTALSLEARFRLQALIKARAFDAPLILPAGEELRAVRAIAALERIGSAEAGAILKELAGGAPWARRTREAERALGRLSARR